MNKKVGRKQRRTLGQMAFGENLSDCLDLHCVHMVIDPVTNPSDDCQKCN